MHSQYIYEPLSYDHEYCQPIRLIRILPGVSDELILCELFKTYLTTSEGRQKRESVEGTLQETPENLEYDALSYAWGDAQDRVAIHVNGKTLLVTQNLWSFLRHQRDTFAPTDNSDRTFWIDAICIDQMNLVERSKQVAFMADIYKEAKLVLAWLGEEDNASRMAFDFLLCPDTYDSSVLEYVEDALFDTFDGGYWDRLWIVQELHHARRIIVRCGPRELDWKLIRPRAHPGPLARITEIEDYRESRNPQHQSKWDEHSQALAVLETYGIKGCTDPRDSVFGLRSLTYDLMSVIPDYSMSAADVYTAAARAIISSSGSILLLEKTNKRKISGTEPPRIGPRTDDLPSWVPDWKVCEYGSLSWLLGRNDLNAGHNVLKLFPHDNPRVLVLGGIIVDTVLRATAPYNHPYCESWDWRKIAQQLHCWLPECNIGFIQDCLFNPAPLRAGRVKRLDIGRLLDHYFQLIGYQGTFCKNDIDLPYSHELEGNIVLTTKTGYAGIAFGEPKMDDILFVAYGSRYPFIIRRSEAAEESYKLIGCAYIQGLMNGESIELKAAGKAKERTIFLV